eukprot:jgi/Chlat1/1951/Chrsp157S00123
MDEVLASDIPAIRSRGVLLLARCVESGAPFNQLSHNTLPQLAAITQFFTSRLADYPSLSSALAGTHACTRQLASLSTSPPSSSPLSSTALDAVAKGIAERIFAECHIQSLPLRDRKLGLEIMHTLLQSFPTALSTMGSLLVEGVLAAVDGEKDPRCLLVAFSLISLLPTALGGDGNNHILMEAAEEVADVLACYFPITFTPPPGDPYGVTKDMLEDALTDAMTASRVFAPHVIPMVLEKLSSTLTSAKASALHVLRTLLTRCPFHPDIARYASDIADALSLELASSPDSDIPAAAACVTAMVAAAGDDIDAAARALRLRDVINGLGSDVGVYVRRGGEIMLMAAAKGSEGSGRWIVGAVAPKVLDAVTTKHEAAAMTLLASLLSAMKQSHAASGRDRMHVDNGGDDIDDTSFDALMAQVAECACNRLADVADEDITVSAARLLAAVSLASPAMPHAARTRAVSALAALLLPSSTSSTSSSTNHDDNNNKRTAALDALVACASVGEDGSSAVWDLCCVPALARINDNTSHHRDDALAIVADVAARGPEGMRRRVLAALTDKVSVEDGERAEAVLASLAQKIIPACGQAEDQPLRQLALRLLLSPQSASSSSTLSSRWVGAAGEAVRACVQRLGPDSQRAVVKQGLCDLLQQTQVSEDVVVSMSSAAVVALRPEISTTVPLVSQLVDRYTAFITLPRGSDDESDTAPVNAATHAIASIVNKCGDSEIIDTYISRALADIAATNTHSSKSITTLAWISRSLALRAHPRTTKIATRLLDVVTTSSSLNPTLSYEAARAFAFIVSPSSSSSDALSRESHAIVKPLYQQRFFSTMIGTVLARAREADEERKGPVYAALVGMGKETPPGVLKQHAQQLLGPLLDALRVLSTPVSSQASSSLTSATAEALHNALLLLSVFLTDNGSHSLLVQHAASVVDRLLAAARFEASARVRETAMQCLCAAAGAIGHAGTYPYRGQVLRGLGRALDDRKRGVRREAVRCRQVWTASQQQS